MKQPLQYAARMAILALPGGETKIVMDSPLYPVHRFAPLVAQCAAALKTSAGRLPRHPGFKISGFIPVSEGSFNSILTLKSRRNPPILSCPKTGSGYRKQPGGITGGRLTKGSPRGRDVAQ